MANDKEFDRSVCFTFYESYLTQAELIKEQYGANEAYDSLSGIIKYALYKEEPANIMAKIVLEGLKNTIDAGQAKRASGFAKKSNAEMDEKIIQYKKDNPDATYEQIKEALGCSKGKISKVLKNSVHVHDVHDHNTVNVNVNKNQMQYQNPVQSKTLRVLMQCRVRKNRSRKVANTRNGT